MRRLEWTPEAQSDLADIQSYTEQYNPRAASALRETIERGAKLLLEVPFGFRAGRLPGTREYHVHPSYVMVYQVSATRVKILRAIHSRRRYP